MQGLDCQILASAKPQFWYGVAGFQIEIWQAGMSLQTGQKLLCAWNLKFNLFLLNDRDIQFIKEADVSEFWTKNSLNDSVFGTYSTLFGFSNSLNVEVVQKRLSELDFSCS